MSPLSYSRMIRYSCCHVWRAFKRYLPAFILCAALWVMVSDQMLQLAKQQAIYLHTPMYNKWMMQYLMAILGCVVLFMFVSNIFYVAAFRSAQSQPFSWKQGLKAAGFMLLPTWMMTAANFSVSLFLMLLLLIPFVVFMVRVQLIKPILVELTLAKPEIGLFEMAFTVIATSIKKTAGHFWKLFFVLLVLLLIHFGFTMGFSFLSQWIISHIASPSWIVRGPWLTYIISGLGAIIYIILLLFDFFVKLKIWQDLRETN
ncbi:hypothetical protein N9Y17_02450 [Gammaproteobacteria bacterium]|nr:hypothetical protein [Gammaproteobacteria bacterium]